MEGKGKWIVIRDPSRLVVWGPGRGYFARACPCSTPKESIFFRDGIKIRDWWQSIGTSLYHHRPRRSISRFFPCVGRYRQLLAMAAKNRQRILPTQFTENSNPISEILRPPSGTGDEAWCFPTVNSVSFIASMRVLDSPANGIDVRCTANFHQTGTGTLYSRIYLQDSLLEPVTI